MAQNLPCQHRSYLSIDLTKSSKKVSQPLSNGDTTLLLDTRRLALVYRPADTVRLLLGSGITTNHRLFTVADEDRNGSLANDPVHYVQPDTNKTAYYCKLPVICIKNLPLLAPDSKDNLYLRLAPVTLDAEWFTSFFAVAAYAGGVRTALVTDYYLSGSYNYKDTAYSIRILLYPLTYFFYNKEANIPRKDFALVEVLPTGGHEPDILLNRYLPTILKSQADPNYYFKAGHHYIRFDSIDLPHNRLVISLRDSPPPPSPPVNIAAARGLHIAANRQQTLLRSGRPAILHFSGSWCRPCHEALPAFKALYQRYRGSYQFVTIMAESKAATARTASQKYRLPWPAYYEQLSCKTATCLQQRLGISIFPAYLLVAANGDVLKMLNSVEELEEAITKQQEE